MSAYKKTEKYKAYLRAYSRARYQTPKDKAYRSAYSKRPDVIARQKASKMAYRLTHPAERRASCAAYRRAPKYIRNFFQLLNTANTLTKLHNETSQTAN